MEFKGLDKKFGTIGSFNRCNMVSKFGNQCARANAVIKKKKTLRKRFSLVMFLKTASKERDPVYESFRNLCNNMA